MTRKNAPDKDESRRPSGTHNLFPRSRKVSARAQDAAREQELNDVDREIIGALTDLRDTLRARTPLETKYTVRQVGVVVPPPQLGPEDVRRTREVLGVSQPVFADFLGTSTSTIRSWEQGQKTPSPMARRLLSLIAADPIYWNSQFSAMAEIRGGEDKASGIVGDRSSGVALRSHNAAATKKSWLMGRDW
jgi:putative transcriptional regulator